MKILFRSALGLAALALIASCSTAVDIVDNSTKAGTGSTKKLMVELPASLTPSTTPAAGSYSRAVGTYTSAGYQVLYSAVTMAKTFTPFMAQFGIMVDAAVSQNNLSPSSTLHTGLKVNVTQAMVDQMKAAVPANLLDAGSLPAVGSSDMPDFVYNISANSHFAYSMELTLPGGAGTETVYWNQDKSKFGMSVSMSGMTFVVANDDATQSTVMNIDSSGMSYAVKFRADPLAKDVHGVFVTVDNSFTMGSTTSTSTVLGYGDDNGGAVTFNTSFGGTSVVYKEVFTGVGAVTYQALTMDTVTTVNVGTDSTTYDSKLGNTSWGDASTFF